MLRNLLVELVLTAAATATLTVLAPGHATAATGAVIATWAIFQGVCLWSFMRALYDGDIIEHAGRPRRYTLAPHACVNFYARHFLTSFLARPEPRHADRAPTIER